jgi:hypothetical protein
MEWFPNGYKDYQDDELNPDGTVSIEYNLNTNQFDSVIFVGGLTYAKGPTFPSNDVESITAWIEEETGLSFGKQFELLKAEGSEFVFQECWKGVLVSPTGRIEVELDEHSRLIRFSKYGQFPSTDRFMEEDYSLTIPDVKEIAKGQIQLLDMPLNDQKRLKRIFALEEIYIRNDKSSTIPFEVIVDVRAYTPIEEVLYWETKTDLEVERKPIFNREQLTVEQFFSNEPHLDVKPLTKDEIDLCINTVRAFLSSYYEADSGRWVLKTLHREQGCIYAIVKTVTPTGLVFQRKLLVMIDPVSFEVLNFMDNEGFLDVWKSYTPSVDGIITREQAFTEISKTLTLTPTYVYDFAIQQYVLCGKLDSDYGVDSVTGELIKLDDL